MDITPLLTGIASAAATLGVAWIAWRKDAGARRQTYDARLLALAGDQIEQRITEFKTDTSELRHEVAELRAENAELRRLVEDLRQANAELRQMNAELRARLEELLNGATNE